MIITGVILVWRNSFNTLKPFFSGSIISNKTTSKVLFLIVSIAILPSNTLVKMYPSPCKYSFSNSLNSRLSSTSNIFALDILNSSSCMTLILNRMPPASCFSLKPCLQQLGIIKIYNIINFVMKASSITESQPQGAPHDF